MFILAVPLAAFLLLPLLDSVLIRQTERRLIGEAVVIGEAYRESWLKLGEDERLDPPGFRPPGRETEHFIAIEPILDMSYEALPPAPPPTRFNQPGERRAFLAGRTLIPLLERVQVFNLSGIRVTNADGCVVASTSEELGWCLEQLAEVEAALAGRYAALVRQRVSDEPAPPLTSIRRRGTFRVFIALPIFSAGDVIGVVRLSRTAVSPLEALYAHRGKVALLGLLSLVLTPAVTYFLSHQISKPVRALTANANTLARDEPAPEFSPSAFAPREVVTLADALERMTRQLGERTSYIQEFASNVSHELKTPLTGITGAVELLQDQFETMTSQQRERFLDNIAGDAERMERLVTGLLQLARIQPAEEDAIDIDLETFLAGLCERYGESIRTRLDADVPPLTMNPEHLQMAVANLIDNAIRHGGGAPVEVSVGAVGSRVAIRVRDHGPGISEGNLPHIFDRFFTTERERTGTGLGLPIVKAVADTRGGSVRVDSSSDGSTFLLIV
ncbi:MAG: histidine kinase [bacterium]|nr:histidine kinase [bacterium]